VAMRGGFYGAKRAAQQLVWPYRPDLGSIFVVTLRIFVFRPEKFALLFKIALLTD